MIAYVSQYATKVVSGEILASKNNIQVCYRHISFIKNPPHGCYWDNRLAHQAI
ncbi:hypothetical protein JMUB7511_27360 [Staphylococcus aureus]